VSRYITYSPVKLRRGPRLTKVWEPLAQTDRGREEKEDRSATFTLDLSSMNRIWVTARHSIVVVHLVLQTNTIKGVRKGEGLGLNTPFDLGILQKLYYLRKGDQLFSHTFCLLIFRLNANTTEKICMQILRSIANGPKSNNYLLVAIWIIVFIQKPTHHFLQIFPPLCMFKIVFRDSSLYPKQLTSLCLQRLISASADHIG